MKIPFVGPSAVSRSQNADNERSVNVFLEQGTTPGREWALYGTPGTVLRATMGAGPHRGAKKCGAYTYWVGGNTVYRMDAAFAVTALGTIGTSTGRVGMAENGTQVLIVDGVSGWIATSSTLTEIADPDFPDGVTYATYQDGFFIVTGNGTQQFYINETPGSGTAWNGLDFAAAEGLPDNLTVAISVNRELWLGGDRSFEVFVNTGASFPFERLGSTFIQYGTASPWTVAEADSAIFWLGAGDDGDGMVFRSQGYAPVRISHHALEEAIRKYPTISDAFAYCFQMAGHSFYVLTFPTADATWLYDVATKQWYEWLWRDPAANELHRHRANTYVFSDRRHLVGDWQTGKVYTLDLDTYSDAGDAIMRLRRTQTTPQGKGRTFFGQMVIYMETGVGTATGPGSDPHIMLRYSNDDGHSWSNERQISIGTAGDYNKRVRCGPTGSALKGRAWELSMTDPVKFALFGADVDVGGVA